MGKLTINGQRVYIYYYWLVVYLPLWKDDIPHIMENKKCWKPPTRSWMESYLTKKTEELGILG